MLKETQSCLFFYLTVGETCGAKNVYVNPFPAIYVAWVADRHSCDIL